MGRMDRIITIRERRTTTVERKRRALDALRPILAAYARRHDGRFLLFGSAARGEMRFDSDIDILVDFPRSETDGAWVFAEDACRAQGLIPDIRPRSWCSAGFLEHIEPEIDVLA